MQTPQDFENCNWFGIPADALPDIKVEAQPADFSLFSPPSSPSQRSLSASSSATTNTSLCRRRTSTLASPKRVRPYPAVNPRSHIDPSSTTLKMTTAPSYGSQWARGKSRSSDEAGPSYNSFTNMPQQQQYSGRTPSSSLTGAMGDQVHHARYPGSPSQEMAWSSVSQQHPMYSDPLFQGQSAYFRHSPESLSPPTPFMTEVFPQNSPPYGIAHNIPSPSAGSSESSITPTDDVQHLRRRITQLEQKIMQDKERIAALEAQLGSSPRSSVGPAPPPSAAFQASWRARSEARIRQFCSLNRAGNALCSWHDSRRERRIHPPRMAPPGYLNCGCTFEEALFEESLSRHGVGSYLPGDSVRMDPALRNPLLRLLQGRYGYRDGDFERNPVTGDWIEGEGHEKWEAMVSGGVLTNPRRLRIQEHERR